MKSDIIHITSSGKGIEEALNVSEKVAEYNGISGKGAIHLRLLTEEMMGLMQGLTGEQEADFWIENEKNRYELHLLSKTEMNSEKRARLIAVSTSGKNDVKGIRAKLKNVFEAAIISMNSGYNEAVSLGLVETNGNVNRFSEWTLSRYKDEAQGEEWDELEQSIVAKLADEIRVCVSGSNVEMTIEKEI